MPPPPSDIDPVIRAVDQAIRERETRKVLSEPNQPHPLDASPEARSAFDCLVQQIVEVAGWAPFHHARKALDVKGQAPIAEPWRFYLLDRGACLSLLAKIDETLDPEDRRGKIPGLLAGAGAMVQVMWIPEQEVEVNAADAAGRGEQEKHNRRLEMRNEEHLAATAAAIQNLLLAAQARGLATYWSSGGLLRDKRMQALLGIPDGQKPIGSIFMAPAPAEFGGKVQTHPGGQRAHRTGPASWCRRVSF